MHLNMIVQKKKKKGGGQTKETVCVAKLLFVYC